MMKRRRKYYIAASVLLASVMLSSCTDISQPVETTRHTVKPPSFEGGAAVTAANGVLYGFETTSDTDAPYLPAQSEYTGSTTFPIQTTPEENLVVEDTAPHETALPPETAAATAAATAEFTTTAQTSAPETAATPAITAAQVTDSSYNVIGENGILVSYQNGHYMGLMGCFGTYTLCERWANGVNTFAAKLPGVKVYNMVVPIPSEFYTPKYYWDTGFTVSQYNKIDYIRSKLSGVTDVDGYSALAAHADEYIYARTDHHWQPLGAYYATKMFAEAAGVDYPSLDKYTPVTKGGYVGSMYMYSKDVHLYSDPENFTMYISPNNDALETTYYNQSFRNGYKSKLFVASDASSYYCSFLGTDDIIAEISTDVKNGRTLVIFKESFGNAVVPFLTSGFEKIYVCDIRYFNLNAVQFCKDVGATDLLFAVCTMTAAGENCKYLDVILGN